MLRSVSSLVLLISAGLASAGLSPNATVGQEVTFGDGAGDNNYQRVVFQLDVTGTIRLKPGSAPERSLPLELSGKFQYQEKLIQTEPSIQVARHYESATADIRVGGGASQAELVDGQRDYVLEKNPDPRTAKLRFRRPDGPITAEQSELIEVPVDSGQLQALLPVGKTVALKSKWKPEADSLAALLWIDNVTQSEVECTLHQVKGNEAVIFCTGQVLGGANGVAAELRLTGQLNYDIKKDLVTSYKFTVQDKRAISQAQPGFEITAKIDARLAPAASNDILSDALISSWDIDEAAPATAMEFRSDHGGFRFLHDASWTVIQDTKPVTVLRLVDQGDLVAQCNISRLQDLSEGHRISMNEFKLDVQKAITPNQGQVIQDETIVGYDGAEVLRVVAGGVIEQVPLQWIYYHITNKKGQRVALIVSLENEMLDRFQEADRSIIETLELLDVEATPTDADSEKDAAATKKSTAESTNSIKR